MLLILASCTSTPLAESSSHVMVLAAHALADIPLELPALATLPSSEILALISFD